MEIYLFEDKNKECWDSKILDKCKRLSKKSNQKYNWERNKNALEWKTYIKCLFLFIFVKMYYNTSTKHKKKTVVYFCRMLVWDILYLYNVLYNYKPWEVMYA